MKLSILVGLIAVVIGVVALPAVPVVPAALAVHAVSTQDESAKILRSEFSQEPEGGYNYGFETDNGIQKQEQGELKEVVDEENKPHNVIVVRGSYSYTDKEGKSETVNYFADETGYHAEGDSIPKPARR